MESFANAAKTAAVAAADKSLADAVEAQNVANQSVATFAMIWEYARGLAVTAYSGPHCPLCSEKYVNGSGTCVCDLTNQCNESYLLFVALSLCVELTLSVFK